MSQLKHDGLKSRKLLIFKLATLLKSYDLHALHFHASCKKINRSIELLVDRVKLPVSADKLASDKKYTDQYSPNHQVSHHRDPP